MLRTPWTVAHQASLSLSFPSLSYLLEFAQTHVQWVIDAIQPFYPLSPPSPLAFNISQHHGLFQWVSSLHQVAKYIGPSASASVLPVNVQGWFPLVFDRCHLLAVQGTLKSLFQHHRLNASILKHSAYFMVQISYPYMTIRKEKNIALTIHNLASKVMSLLFNVLSRFVIAFVARSKGPLILWFQSLSAVIYGAQENSIYHCFHPPPISLPWRDGTRCHDLGFLNLQS